MSRKIKLAKGLSYTGSGIKATRENPVVAVDDDKAEKLIQSGYFVGLDPSEDTAAASMPSEAAPMQEEDPTEAIADSLKDKTKAELTEYAAGKGIDLAGYKTKAQILDAIVAATLQAKEARKALKGA